MTLRKGRKMVKGTMGRFLDPWEVVRPGDEFKGWLDRNRVFVRPLQGIPGKEQPRDGDHVKELKLSISCIYVDFDFCLDIWKHRTHGGTS